MSGGIKITKINSINVLDDEAMENVSGGTQRQTQELFDYVFYHDPDAWKQITSNAYPTWMLMRYLNDKGVPIVGFAEYDHGDNLYVFGDRDTDNIMTGKPVSHEEVMALMQEKIV